MTGAGMCWRPGCGCRSSGTGRVNWKRGTVMARVHTCGHAGCGVRLILAKGLPPLNALPDPLGTVAARKAVSGAYVARFLARDEEPDASLTERRFSLHDCEGTRHAAQRDQVRRAKADLARAQRNRRGHRAGPQITGYVRQPPTLPGLGDQ